MKLANGTILMVVDGARMLLLQNCGDTRYPDLRVIEHCASENPPNREIHSDSPGTSFSSQGPGRSSYEMADSHQQDEDRFAADAALALGQAAQQHEGDLVVVAPPRTLGVLRRHYDRTVKARLIEEIDKDLTKHPVEEITRIVMAH